MRIVRMDALLQQQNALVSEIRKILRGGVKQILTGWVLGRLPGSDEDVARAEQTVVRLLTGGLVGTSAVVAA